MLKFKTPTFFLLVKGEKSSGFSFFNYFSYFRPV